MKSYNLEVRLAFCYFMVELMFFSSSQHHSAVSAPLGFMLCSPTPHPQVPWAGTMSIIDVPSVVGMKWASFSVHGGNWALQLAARGPVTQLELLAKRRCSRLDQEHCRIILETFVPQNFFFFFLPQTLISVSIYTHPPSSLTHALLQSGSESVSCSVVSDCLQPHGL